MRLWSVTMARLLNDWIEAYLEFVKDTEPPRMFHLWCAISTVAAALQRKVWLQWGTITFYPNMYIVLVAPSGRARKGTAIGPALDIMTSLNIPLAAEAITREALIRELCNAKEPIPDLDGLTSSTVHSSLTIISPELTVFLGYHNQQLLSDLTDWYDCRKRWRYRTKNMGEDDIYGVWVNLLGATTPDLLRSALPMDAIGGGLTSRIIFVFEEDKGKIAPAPVFLDKELQDKLYHDIEEIHMMRGPYRITPGFLDLWVEWYIKQHENPPFNDPRLDGYVERRPTHVMKLSMIISAARRPTLEVTGHDLQDAIDILTATERKMPKAFSGVGMNSTSAVMERIMGEIGLRGKIQKGELYNLVRFDVSYRDFEDIMRGIETTGFAKKVVEDGDVFYVHISNTEQKEVKDEV